MHEVKERLKEQMDICRERAESSKDSEEFERFIESETKLAKALAEIEKNEKEQSLDKQKFEESRQAWRTPTFWIPVLVPVVASVATLVIGKVMDRNTLRQQTRDICNFELTNTFTTQAGKGLAGCLRMFPILNNRGDH